MIHHSEKFSNKQLPNGITPWDVLSVKEKSIKPLKLMCNISFQELSIVISSGPLSYKRIMDVCWSVAVGSRLQPKQWREYQIVLTNGLFLETCPGTAQWARHTWVTTCWNNTLTHCVCRAGFSGARGGNDFRPVNPPYERPKTYRRHIYKLRVRKIFYF